MQAGRIHRVLIVAPLSILSVWEAEFAQFAAFDYALAVLTGDSAKKTDTLRHMNGAALQVAVVNYESAWRRAGAGRMGTGPHCLRRGP